MKVQSPERHSTQCLVLLRSALIRMYTQPASILKEQYPVPNPLSDKAVAQAPGPSGKGSRQLEASQANMDVWASRPIVLGNPHRLCYANSALLGILQVLSSDYLQDVRNTLQLQADPCSITQIPGFELSIAPWTLANQQRDAAEFFTHLTTWFNILACSWSLEIRYPDLYFAAEQGGPC